MLAHATLPQAQGTPPPTPLTLIAREGRRAVPTTVLSGQELIALDDVAALFPGVTIREDALAGGVTVTYRGRTIVASPDQPMASVAGRVIALPSPIVRSGRRWLVPLEFLPRALGPIHEQRIDLRRAARLLIVGDLRVPRVTARIDAPGPPTRATIELAPAAPVTVNVEAGRVILRIEADALELALPAAGGGLIEQVRAGDQPNTVTVALSAAAGTARATTTTADNVARVAVEVPPAIAAPAETNAPRPPVPGPPAPLEGPPLVSPRTGIQTVVIDPGHGGEDVGAKGAGGTQEKQLTLDVARRLRGLIETRLGLRVLLTRDDDRAVSLDERAALANNSKADLFLSLHANAAVSPALAGAEVFYLRLDADAARAAASSAVTIPVLGGGTRTIDVIRWDLAQATHVETSARLATLVHEALRQRVPMSPRTVQGAPLRVLSAANMPAALVEMAYLTNGAQEKAAGGDEFRNTVAQALFDAVVRFRAAPEESAP